MDKNTEIIILGTLPSDKSLAAGQCYANPGTTETESQVTADYNEIFTSIGPLLDSTQRPETQRPSNVLCLLNLSTVDSAP